MPIRPLTSNMEEETFGATRMFNRYYKMVFGKTEYIKQRLRNVFQNCRQK